MSRAPDAENASFGASTGVAKKKEKAKATFS